MAGRGASREGWLRLALVALGILLALVLALLAGFGWLYALRAMGALDFGPGSKDSLPLLQLAGHSTQPLARLVVAWVPVGAIAGAALVGLPRARRAGLVLLAALVLLALASELAYAVAHTRSLADIISSRRPGRGPLIEALLFALGAGMPRPRRRPHGAHVSR